MKKTIFLDRDGIINYDSPNYIRSIDDVMFIPGSLNAIAQLTQSGYQIGLATNQSGVARGYFDVQTLEKIHAWIRQQSHLAGGKIQAIAYCPHGPNDGCECRKPKPGLLQILAQQLNCDLTQTFFIGDKISDIQAAKAAGALPIFISEANTENDRLRQKQYPHVPRFDSLAQWVRSNKLVHSH